MITLPDSLQKKLQEFVPRHYQRPIINALEKQGYKRLLIIWPRRAGKDLTCFNLVIRAALRKAGVYYYIFPTYSQAKKVIWDSITNDGKRFLDYIPAELVTSKTSQEMKITLVNGSIIQLVGSDSIDRLVGTNPQGCVFSEYALQDPRAYQFLRPILLVNDGWSIFESTVRGRSNHLYDMYQIAKTSPDWFVQKLTIEDTGHITREQIDKEIKEGLISEDFANQEYYNDWNLGVEGSYYGKCIDSARLEGRVTTVPYEVTHKVNTVWDLGMRDSTCIIFFQIIGQTIRIIDFYENDSEGLEHYVKVLDKKPYAYGKHIAPHDIQVRELGTGMSRLEKSRQLGVTFIVAPNLTIQDGIEAVRSSFSKFWIDTIRCKELICYLENYRKEFDNKKKVYKDRPLHDASSHAADCLRYLCISLPRTKDSMTPESLNKLRNEALYGGNSNLPHIFR